MTTINNTGWKVVERGRVDDDNNNDDNDDNDNDDDKYRGGGIHGRPSPTRPWARPRRHEHDERVVPARSPPRPSTDTNNNNKAVDGEEEEEERQ